MNMSAFYFTPLEEPGRLSPRHNGSLALTDSGRVTAYVSNIVMGRNSCDKEQDDVQ